MSDFKQVPASEIKIGEVLTPFPGCIDNFRVKSIETYRQNDRDFIKFTGGESLAYKTHIFKCYPTRIVGLSDGDSLVESIDNNKKLIQY